jgi:CubicO group peptidase (beta-lactamase class C family)
VESIERFVAGQLAAWEVPGCAIACVRDGDVVLVAGWGRRDVETGFPVTSDTLFAIGSATKAFTVATVGALADDGLLEWERPLRDYLPEFRLHDPVVTDRLSVVDLLAHRSGLPRHDLTWLGHPDRSRAELVRRLRFLPLSKDLRQAFQYCNLGYLVAGHLVEVLSGSPWEAYLRTRLLTPLGMDRSQLSTDDMLADADHATGYERREGVVVPVPLRPVTAIAPAGAVNSCAADMARWLLAQLSGGQVDGQAVMSPGMVARQHAPHMVLPEDRTFPASTRHAYGGQYDHPGYGTLTITVDGDTLRPHLGTMDMSLAHRHYETFDLEWHELGDQSHLFPLMFLSDPDGDITALTVPFEPSVGPLRFDRLPEAPVRDPEVLRRLCGTYTMGPIEVVVARLGDHVLTVATPGAPPFELQPTRGLKFEVKGQPGITAEFELDQAGAVVRLVAQPLGIFLPKT